MPVKDHIYCNNAKTLKEKVKTMLNNAKYADTMFLVNDKIFHASSHLVAVSSTPLETMISTHFDNCGDREIKIRNIKHSESFNIILKCIYGIEINLTRMNAAVLYEVLCLSESYELVEFATEIKTYLTKLEEFNNDSIIALLNTAKKFNLKEVYERLTKFAYMNTKEIVKHASFKDVHYDVLIDLLPSDWFYAKEIDILSGVLTWHSVMYNEAHGQNKNQIEASHVNNDISKSVNGNVEIHSKEERNSDLQTEVSNRETESETVNTANDNTSGNNAVDDNDRGINDEDVNLGEKTETVDMANDKISGNNAIDDTDRGVNAEDVNLGEKIETVNAANDTTSGNNAIDDNDRGVNDEDVNLGEKTETVDMANDNTSGNNAIDDTDRGVNAEDVNSEENNLNNTGTKIDTNIVRTFSDNVLKSLLAHVRISQISIMDLNAASESEVFKKYKTYFSTNNHFSLSLIPRCELISNSIDISEPLQDFLMTTDLRRKHVYWLEHFFKMFTVNCMSDPDELVFSDDKYSLLKDLNVCVAAGPSITNNTIIYVSCDQKGSSSSKAKWQCTGECQVTIISRNLYTQNLVLPSTDSYRTVMFTPTHSQEEFEFELPSDDFYEFTGSNSEFQIEVQFVSLEIKLQEI